MSIGGDRRQEAIGALLRPQHSLDHAGASGRDCVAIANGVRSAHVPAAMVRAFEAAPNKPLAERLCAALQAGNDAGGEFKQVTSAGLLVVPEHAFPYVDLRVDDHPDPIAEITRLWMLSRRSPTTTSSACSSRTAQRQMPSRVGYLTAEEARAVLAKEEASR